MSASESINKIYKSYSGLVILFMIMTIICQGIVIFNLYDNDEMLYFSFLNIFVILSNVIIFVIQFCMYRKLNNRFGNDRYKNVWISFLICVLICLCAMVATLRIAGNVSHTGTNVIFQVLRVNFFANFFLVFIALVNGNSIKKYIVQELRTLDFESDNEKITR